MGTSQGAKKLVKLFLHEDYDDVESVWAEVVGKTPEGALLRLTNVPFVHAKPTYGDVVVASQDEELDVPYAWNVGGIKFSQIGKHLHEDAGRYAAIVDYKLPRGATFKRFTTFFQDQDVMTEGCYAPKAASPGRLYLAVPKAIKMASLMAGARERFPTMELAQIHPEVRAPKKKKRRAR